MIRFISTLTAANEWDILAELTSLMMSDLNSNIKETNLQISQTDKQRQVGQGNFRL